MLWLWGTALLRGLTARSTGKGSSERRAVAVSAADVPSHSYHTSNPAKLIRLAAEPALDKGDDNIKAAEAGEILVPCFGREPTLLRLGKSHSHASDCLGSTAIHPIVSGDKEQQW